MISYQGFGKEQKVHQLSPYLVKEYRNRWYVVGFSDRTESTIVLALDRIQKIKRGESRYISKADFSPGDFFKYSLGITQVQGAEPQNVVLSFAPLPAQYILSQPLHHSQEIIEATGKKVVIQMKLYITQELIMTILSYGENITVVAPEMLRNQIMEMIEKMKGQYKIK